MAWLDKRAADMWANNMSAHGRAQDRDDPEAIFQEGLAALRRRRAPARARLLQRAVEKGYFVAAHPRPPRHFDGLRNDPGLQEVLALAGSGPRRGRWPRSARPGASGFSAVTGRGVKTLARPTTRPRSCAGSSDVRPDSARRWGRMSAPQMVCHLADAFPHGLGQKPVSHVPGLLNRTIVKWIALYAPLRWPPGIVTRPEIDQTLAGCTKPGDFAADVAAGRGARLSHDRAQGGLRVAFPSIFGQDVGEDWLRWGYLHMDHHLRQFGA
jgi:hypothetical protein